jgi:mono/diheme cytochrome c family protein
VAHSFVTVIRMRTSHSFHAALGVAVLALHACAGSGPASAPPAPSTPAAATTAPASPAAPSATATPARPAAPASREAAPPDPAAIFGGPTPGTEFGFATFQTQCSSCHGNPAVERAPSPDAIRMMPPERIYTALNDGRDAGAGRGE